MATAVTVFASTAAVKLRGQRGAAGAIVVFIRTSPFRADDLQYSGSVTVPLIRPTADTAALVTAAIAGLRSIYRKGYRYAKAGVMLVELQGQDVRQGELDFGGDGAGEWCGIEGGTAGVVDSSPAVMGRRGGVGVGSAGRVRGETRERTKLMTAMDELNGRFGRGALRLAGAGLDHDQKAWSMRQERKTPGYTTSWEGMPVVRA
ncbi:MAG: DUF4113 domain-containing protein [Rhodoferax sp.]